MLMQNLSTWGVAYFWRLLYLFIRMVNTTDVEDHIISYDCDMTSFQENVVSLRTISCHMTLTLSVCCTHSFHENGHSVRYTLFDPQQFNGHSVITLLRALDRLKCFEERHFITCHKELAMHEKCKQHDN